MMRFPIICATLIFSGCATQEPPIGQPACEQPEPVTAQIWNDMGLLREVLSDNSLVYQKCIERLRARIDLHDESL